MQPPSDDAPLDYYRISGEQTLRQLESRQHGLTTTEAAKRLERDGPNVITSHRKNPVWLLYLQQFKDLMIILLLASSFIAWYLDDPRTSAVLFVLAVFNTTIGFLQEFKAGRLMASLEKLVVPEAVTMRGGKQIPVPSAELVVGDVVYVEEGNSVPADLRVLTKDVLSTNDFALTGESNPTRKFTHAISGPVPLAARQNLLFMGTTVAAGHGMGVVIGTGMQTELGRIASLSEATARQASPLQKEMNNIAGKVTQGTIILCLILLPVAINSGLPFKDALLFAIGIACALIPNGLPAAISTSLARAAGKLAKAKALVKKLSAVETLGATSIICTDKTGTLTQNQMTVEELLIGRATYFVTGKGYEPEGDIKNADHNALNDDKLQDLELFFITGALASNARVNPPDEDHASWYVLGDPTEGAVVALAQKAGINTGFLEHTYPELREFGFDAARKRMSSIRMYGLHKEPYVFVKGAPENVLERCTHIWDHGTVRPLHAAERDYLLHHNEQKALTAMRNLGLAYRVLPKGADVQKMHMDDIEDNLVWLGMVSMIDPLRAEVPAAMEVARRANIKVSIITGDYAVTAKAIAVRAKLTDDPKDIIVVTGEELEALSDARVLELAARGGVIFSRVSPEDKLRIVGLVQDSGKVVAVTGDGINDAPALKRADIGVAMGITGTDVAKQAAEIILLDDSFNTLVGAVQEGRVIFQNIKKATICSFTNNAAELMVNLMSLAGATIAGIPLALTVLQILAIDIIAELFPIAALGGDRADRDLMREEARNPKHHILNVNSVADLAWSGLLIGGLTFMNYLWFFTRHGVHANTVATDSALHFQATALTYLTLVLCLLANVLLRRSEHGLFTRYQLHNKSLWVAIALSLFCVANIIYNPWLTNYFHTAPLTLADIVTAVGSMALFVAIREFQRWSNKHHSREAVLALHRSLK
ncbi:MAG TPA: cation-transporting P-type ATPase [Candidatus Saccharimonadales bacterium]|nr:cation-transporting P-type ATPase [Candidatus Saccharimonadales bacterium]